jgi:hypothetical protein
MKALVLLMLLTAAACTSGPPKLTEPPKNAPVWDLNGDKAGGSNDLVQAPTRGDQ